MPAVSSGLLLRNILRVRSKEAVLNFAPAIATSPRAANRWPRQTDLHSKHPVVAYSYARSFPDAAAEYRFGLPILLQGFHSATRATMHQCHRTFERRFSAVRTPRSSDANGDFRWRMPGNRRIPEYAAGVVSAPTLTGWCSGANQAYRSRLPRQAYCLCENSFAHRKSSPSVMFTRPALGAAHDQTE